MNSANVKFSAQSFSPECWDEEVLESILVGRRRLVDRLEELVLDGVGGGNKHQRLIIGVRGSGKTHILRALYNRLNRNKELNEKLLIIYLLEDEMGVATFLDFLMRMLRAIIRWNPQYKKLGKDIETIYDLSADMQESRAIRLLLDAVGSKDALILAENLGITFDNVKGFGKDGQQKLRDFIQANPMFMIFATSQALVAGTRDPDYPFYGFFKPIHLARLSESDAMDFLISIATATKNSDVVKFLGTPKGRAHMRTVYDFTGGNHRLLVTFYEFLATDSLARLGASFVQALAPLRPYYQEQMRSLSAQQQKIIQYLSLQRKPQAVKDIARGCLAPPNSLSSQLRSLLNLNFVSKIEQGRESYYEVTETLFRICYEADLDRDGAPVRLFVDFLANLYTAQELQLRWRGYCILANRLGNLGGVPFLDEAAFYKRALSLYHPQFDQGDERFDASIDDQFETIHQFFDEMIEAKAYKEIVEFAPHFQGVEDAYILHTTATAHVHLGDNQKAEDNARAALLKDPDDPEAHLVLADVMLQAGGANKDAQSHASRARELMPEDPRPLELLGAAYGNDGDHNKALETFEELTREHPQYANGWALLGMGMYNTGKLAEAEQAIRKSLELNSENKRAVEALGLLLAGTERSDEALDQFKHVNDTWPDYASGWVNTGNLLQDLDRKDEAANAYRRALELDSNNPDALEGLGVTVGNLGRHKEALDCFRKLNSVASENSHGWVLTGRALEILENTKEAELSYRHAIELDQNNTNALKLLGILVGNCGRDEEALTIFQRLNEKMPNFAEGWRLIGKALQNLKREDESESAYRKALKLDPKNTTALESLGVMLGDDGRMEEALKLFQRLNDEAPTYAEGWSLTGKALQKLDQSDEAERVFRKALELDPSNANALKYLGLLVGVAGRNEEALALFRKLNNVQPNDADGWRLTGQFLKILHDESEAEKAFRVALDLNPNQRISLEELIGITGTSGRHEEAIALCRKLNEVVPDYAHGWALTGAIFLMLKEEGDAEAACRKALELDASGPTRSYVLYSLGVVLSRSGRHEEALDMFRKLSEEEPENPDCWHSIGYELNILKRTEESIASYRKALSIQPDSSTALLGLAYTYGDACQYEEALRFSKKLNEVDPSDSSGWRETCVTLVCLGREDEAQEAFNKAISHGEDRSRLLNSRGEALRGLGKYELALEDYAEALKADPKAVWPHFNMVSCHLALGNVDAALGELPTALKSDIESASPRSETLLQSFQENWQELFEHGPTDLFNRYSMRALDMVEEAGYIDQFEKAVPMTVISLLRNHNKIDENRFSAILKTFVDVISEKIDGSVAVRFLETGKAHFKKKDKKALLALTREERNTFCKQLGIENPVMEGSV